MPGWSTLVGAADFIVARESLACVVFDCRFVLTNLEEGELAYRAAHVAGARYAHLERDLSGAAGAGGRHPLPVAESFIAWASAEGVSDTTQVVVYDDGVGAFAARLWWMFRWIGHEHVAVLDGGLSAWQSAGGATESGFPTPAAVGQLARRPSSFDTRTIEEVASLSASGEAHLVDARDRSRYLGECEPFASVAGHIPSAKSRPFLNNCNADGTFKSGPELRSEFDALGAGEKVCYCGSGVTACHNVLAAVHAGLPPPALYVGSWSQWVLDSTRPVATGPE